MPSDRKNLVYLFIGLMLLASSVFFASPRLDESLPIDSPSSPTAKPINITSELASESLQFGPTPHPVPTGNPPDPVATPTCNPSKTVSGEIDTSLLEKPMRYLVYLPQCYDQDTQVRYPVLYLFHGQDNDETEWIRIGATSTADRLISSGQIPPFIIVFPYDYSSLQPAQYKFEEVFTTMLVPQIDALYRTKADRQFRAVGGMSRGGGWAIYLGLRHPDMFGEIGGHSPAIFYSTVGSLPLWLEEIPPYEMPRIYMDMGDNDKSLQSVEVFESQLTTMDIAHEWHSNIGYHDTDYWSAHVEEYLRWYTEGWK